MTQIINSSTPGKERDRLSKAIIITIRAYLRQGKFSQETKDMIGFIILALQEISSGIDLSVNAWEKRGYWVKADKYRMEWNWTEQTSNKLANVFDKNDQDSVITILLEIMNRFSNLKVSDRHRMGEPWKNAYKKYAEKFNN